MHRTLPHRIHETRRRLSAQIKSVLETASAVDLLSGLDKLRRGLAERNYPGHTPEYVRWVIETAAKIVGQTNAREFARSFYERPIEYSTTPAGLSALMLEVWLSGSGKDLFSRFVETVVDTKDSFLVVFEGTLKKAEFDKLQADTREFVKSFKLLVAAGQQNADNMVSDLTIFEAFPARGLKPDDVLKTAKDKEAGDGTETSLSSDGGLTPESTEDYARVIEEGGVSTAAMPVVFSDPNVLREAIATSKGLAIRDHNHVVWECEDGSDRWIPVLAERSRPSMRNPADLSLWRTALSKATTAGREGKAAVAFAVQWYENQGGLWEASGPPGLRPAPRGSWQSCETCTYYDPPTRTGAPGLCQQFNVDVKTSQLCDVWDGHETGAESIDTPRVSIVQTEEVTDVTPEVHIIARPFEETEQGVIRSHSGSWALFESDGGTVVVAESNAWFLELPIHRVLRTVESLASCYGPPALEWESDRCIEHALAEWAATEGTEVENVNECVAVAGADSKLLHERSAAMARYETIQEADEEDEPEEDEPEDEPEDDSDDTEEQPGEDSDEEPEDSKGEQQPPPPPEPTDRMDAPEFYREDLQTYYDIQIVSGNTPERSAQKTKLKFKIKELTVTPVGEVRSPGVVDKKSPPPPAATPGGSGDSGAPPAPIEQPDGAPDPAGGAPAAPPPPPPKPEESRMHEVASVVAAWAKKSGKSQDEAERLWKKAGDIASKNYPDLTPESEDWYRVKMGIFRRIMGVAVESQFVKPETVDDAFHRWVRSDVGEVEDFEEWLGDNYPDLLSALPAWTPRAVNESRAREDASELTDEQISKFEKWSRLLNMTISEVRSMSRRVNEATTSLSVSGLRAFHLGRKSSRRLISMKSKSVEAWDENDWQWASKQINAVSRLRATHGPLIDHTGKPTEKLILLRAWGHEPRVRSHVAEREVIVKQRPDWRCKKCHAIVREHSFVYDTRKELWEHECGAKLIFPVPDEEMRRRINRDVIDSTPGSLPCLIGERTAPAFADLKKARTQLTPEERTEVMKRKAVWHPGHMNGKAIPAVWKAQIGDTTHFVTNTHRAYNVAPTLKGAIGRFHAFIKSTA